MVKKESAARKLSGELKKFMEEYKDKLLLLAVSFLESKAKNVIEWVKDISHLKRKIRMIVVCFGLVMAGLFLVVFGIADYVAAMFPQLQNGVGKIIVGFIIIILAYLIKKLS